MRSTEATMCPNLEEECKELDELRLTGIAKLDSGNILRFREFASEGDFEGWIREEFQIVPGESEARSFSDPGVRGARPGGGEAALKHVTIKSGDCFSRGTLTCILENNYLVTAHHVVEGRRYSSGSRCSQKDPVARESVDLGGDLKNDADLCLEVSACPVACLPGVASISLVGSKFTFTPSAPLPKKVDILGRNPSTHVVAGQLCAKIDYGNSRKIKLHNQILLYEPVVDGTSGAIVVSAGSMEVVGMVIARGVSHTVVTPWSTIRAALEEGIGSAEFLGRQVGIVCPSRFNRSQSSVPRPIE